MKKTLSYFIVLAVLVSSFVFPSINVFAVERTEPEQPDGQTTIVPMLSNNEGNNSVLKEDSSVWSWVYGEGQLPSKMYSVGSVKAIASGDDYYIALKSDGSVWTSVHEECVPSSKETNDNKGISVQIDELRNVIAISAGKGYNLALKSDGTVWSWDYKCCKKDKDVIKSCRDEKDRKRNGDIKCKSMISKVYGLKDIKAISAGANQSMALKNDGTVWVWNNDKKQDNEKECNEKMIKRPVKVSHLTGIKAISAGDNHYIALKEDGTVWTFGDNKYGQLGDSSNTSSSKPVMVSGLAGVKFISAGKNYSMALKEDGTVWAWGDNTYGQLGDSSYISKAIPVHIQTLKNITAIEAGEISSIALKNDGSVWIWGRHDFIVKSNGTVLDNCTPAPIPGLNLKSSVKPVPTVDYTFTSTPLLAKESEIIQVTLTNLEKDIKRDYYVEAKCSWDGVNWYLWSGSSITLDVGSIYGVVDLSRSLGSFGFLFTKVIVYDQLNGMILVEDNGNYQDGVIINPPKDTNTKFGSTISINNSSLEGSADQLVGGKNSYILHNINEKIPAGKMVIISLSNIEATKKVWDEASQNWQVITDPSANTCSITLTKRNAWYGVSTQLSGGWYSYSKMYYYTTPETGNYAIAVTTKDYDGPYTVNVKVVDIVAFDKEDAVGNTLSAIGNDMHTYCIMSGPEFLGDTSSSNIEKYPYKNQPQYLEGNNGYYIQRSKINGNANVFWEHWNKYKNTKRVRHGILIYNTEDDAVDVNLISRAFLNTKTIQTAILDIWDYWDSGTNGKVQMEGDLSQVSSSVSIPGGQARWICLYDLPQLSDDNIFNGILKLAISKNGCMYTGQKVYCDEYIMDLESMNDVDDFVLNNV